ncbi:MAG: FtsX-like permease family protein [Acidimicrobiales bacterium]|nr:FtsX-like permease family protein [Acidimicrobiales bacterium]
MLKTSLKGLAAHKLRFVATALAVMLGVGFMAGTFVLTDTLQQTFDKLFAETSKGVDAVVRAPEPFESDFGSNRPRIPQSTLDRVLQVDGVATAAGDINTYAQLVDRQGDAIGSLGGAPSLGVAWTDNAELNPFTIEEGRAPEASDEILIDKGSAQDGDFAVGDRAIVLTQGPPAEYEIVGIARFGSSNSLAGASVIAFTPTQAQEVAGAVGKWDDVVAHAQEGVSQDELAANLRAALGGEDLEVITGAEQVEESQNAVQEGLGFFNNFLLTFAVIALFVGCFIIYNTFSIIVAQRTRELALLRALGASRRQVLGSVVLEALVVGLVAALLGIVLGIGVAVGLKALLGVIGVDLPSGGIVVSARTVIASIVVGLVVTVISAIVPARRASRIPPVAAMRDVAVDTSSSSRVRVVLGSAVLAMGVAILLVGLFAGSGASALAGVGVGAAVVFLGVAALGPILATPLAHLLGWPLAKLRGISGQLARENATRNPKRTAATASALMIGVGLVGFITIFAASAQASIGRAIDEQFRADYVVAARGFGGGFSPELAQEIAALPDTAASTGVRFNAFQVDGDTKFLSAADTEVADALFDFGVIAGSLQDLPVNSIAVYQDVAERNDWQVGDTIAANFALTGEVPLTIGAIFENNEAAGNYAIGLDTYDANFQDRLDFQVYVKTAPGTDQDAFRAQLDGILAEYPTAELQDATEFKEAQAAQISQLLNLIYALLGLAVIIALIGIANTLALSIFERTRELGLLRAIGMTRSQLRATVRWESVIIALIGTALGLVIGAFLGWAIVTALSDQGFTELVLPPGQLLVVVLVAALAGVVAALGPTRRASKLDVLEAIASE